MTAPITVVVPVGPRAEDCAYLREAVVSVAAQTTTLDTEVRLLIVDDMHGITAAATEHEGRHTLPWIQGQPPMLECNAWNLGVAASFNAGVALAPTEHVLLLGADDWIEPDAIRLAQEAIERRPTEQAYYWFRVRYSDDRPERDQGQPCGAAVVTKALWRATGGFPVEAAIGRSDVMLVGLLMGHPDVGTLIEIRDDGRPPYNVRVHPDQHTASRGPWVRALEETANAYWATWQQPRWGRYE